LDGLGKTFFLCASNFLGNLVNVAIGPRTDTLAADAAATGELTLSGSNAFKFWQAAMETFCYRSVYNATRSQLAWIKSSSAANKLLVDTVGDVYPVWKSGDTITSSFDNVSTYSKIDAGPIVTEGAVAILLQAFAKDTGAIVENRGIYVAPPSFAAARVQVANITNTGTAIVLLDSTTYPGRYVFDVWERAITAMSAGMISTGYFK